MKETALVFAIANYSLFVWMAAFGLTAEDERSRLAKKIVSLGGTISMASYLMLMFSSASTHGLNWWLATFMFAASILLLGWCISTTRDAQLDFAFTRKPPNRLMTSGPFGLVRHPVYVSYCLGWLGGLFGSASAWGLLPLLGMGSLYILAAREEEKLISESSLSNDYREYAKTVGGWWPRFPRERKREHV